MSSSEELIEIIEVDENWVENEAYGVWAIDANDQNVHSETERQDLCIEMLDKSFYENEADMSEATDSEDQIELIEVEEDWVPRKIEDYEADCQEMNVKEKPNEISTEFYDTGEGRIGELRKSAKELNGSSSFNKKGSVRKRRTFKMPLKQRMAIKKQILEHQHKVRDPCSHDNCNSIDLKRRLAINKEFWNMPYRERYTFGLHSIHRSDVKHRRKGTSLKKENHNDYFLRNEEGEMQEVCKVFYLTTLGFSKRNDNFVKTAVGNKRFKEPLPRIINRVDNLKLEALDYASIIAHINSFKPNVSHHRRVHAPKKKYLPETLTIKSMYADFKNHHAEMKCSYYLYRRIVSNELNISFAQLGHEQCETCEEYVLHNKSLPVCDSCDLCVEYRIHKIKYTEARKLYGAQRLLNTDRKAFYSGDMEKVIMLPRLEMFKQAIFTTRLSAYNDTFAPLGGIEHNPPSSKPVAVIWHEGISGRCKEDIISAFFKFFLLKRDIDECVMWLDNCSSQNKNWALFTFLVYIINSDLINTEKIQFNYFEPGHTFMSADSFHHQVERSMDAMKKLYDFIDFETAVSTANSGNVTVASMTYSDFFKWQDHSSRSKKISGQHYMHEIVQVTAIRGSFDLTYKKSFSSNEEFRLNFLQEKYKKDGIPSPVQATVDCGISKERKENILKLSRIFKEGKTQFYRNLSVSGLSSKSTITASGKPKSNAEQEPVSSQATVTVSEQRKSNSNARSNPAAPHDTMTGSEQLNLNARPEPVVYHVTTTASEQPKLNARQDPLTSHATMSGSEQPNLNARPESVVSHAIMSGSEQPNLNARPDALTCFAAAVAGIHLKLNALPEPVVSHAAMSGSEEPNLNAKSDPLTSFAATVAGKHLKLNARPEPVVSDAAMSSSEEPNLNAKPDPPTSFAATVADKHLQLNARPDPLTSHATMSGSEQPNLNARPEPVVYHVTTTASEQPKLNARQDPLTSHATMSGSEQPNLNARPESVVSHAIMSGSEQPNLNARPDALTCFAAAVAGKHLKLNARPEPVVSDAAMSCSEEPNLNAKPDPPTSFAATVADKHLQLNARPEPVVSHATMSGSEQPNLNAKPDPLTSFAAAVDSEHLKLNAKTYTVASQATVTISEQPNSNARSIPAASHDTMTGRSQRPRSNARANPVASHATTIAREHPKSNSTRGRVATMATVTASAQPRPNTRRKGASRVIVNSDEQPKSNDFKATETAIAQLKPNTRRNAASEAIAEANERQKLNTNKPGKKNELKSQRAKSRAKK